MAGTKRADARRNEEALLEAAAAQFVAKGVDVAVRDVAAAAGVGVGTIYRHFPTRADLIVAVYRHQVEALASYFPAAAASPFAALADWINQFVDFLVTKHGLADALRSDHAAFQSLHAYFIDRLLPVCGALMAAAIEAGQIQPGVPPLELMRGVGNLCIGAENDPGYDPRRLIGFLLEGLRGAPPIRR